MTPCFPSMGVVRRTSRLCSYVPCLVRTAQALAGMSPALPIGTESAQMVDIHRRVLCPQRRVIDNSPTRSRTFVGMSPTLNRHFANIRRRLNATGSHNVNVFDTQPIFYRHLVDNRRRKKVADFALHRSPTDYHRRCRKCGMPAHHKIVPKGVLQARM